MNLHIIEDAAGLAALRAEWTELLERCPAATVFQSWEWCDSWWRHLGRGRLLCLTARADGALRGVLPLQVTGGPLLRRVSFLGCPQADYQDLLAAPADRAACAALFLDHLRGPRRGWDVIDLADVPQDSPLLACPAPAALRSATLHHRLCPHIPLPATYEAFTARLGKNLRAHLGRRRRQLERTFSARFELAGEADLDPALEALYRLHNTRWQRRGLPGAFHAQETQRLHHEVARRFLRAGWLRLHLLRIGGAVRAAVYCFARGGKVAYYLSGFDLELSRYSPGTVLLGEAVRAAIAEGATEFDLLRGNEGYKYEWQAKDRVTVRQLWARPGVRGLCGWWLGHLGNALDHLGTALRRRLFGRRPAPGPQRRRSA